MDLFNLQAEQCILGAILIEPSSIFAGNEIKFSSHDFFRAEHRVIYDAMKKISNENCQIDIITVANELINTDLIDKIGGIPYLTSLVTIVPTSSNILYYMKIVKDFATKRKVHSMLLETQTNIKTLQSEDLIKFSEDLKSLLLNTGNAEDLYVDASTISFNTQNLPAISTGFDYLDSICSGGLTYGSLSILTGEPSSGKSTLLNQIIANAISLGFKCFLYSGELTYQLLMNWFSKTVANRDDLVSCISSLGKYTQVTDEALSYISNWTKDKFFIYSKDARADESNLSSVIEYLAIKKNVRLFILDNLMTLEFSGSDKYEKQINTAKTLKNLAQKYNLAIILVAHPNKSSTMNKEPHVFEISGASEIPNLADYIFKIYKANEEYKTVITVMKNRITGIQKKKLELNFDADRKRFYTESFKELAKDFGYRPNWVQGSIYD